MARLHAGIAYGAVLLALLSACDNSPGEQASTPPTREAEPADALARQAELPATPSTTTTSSPPVDPVEADRLARELLRRVAVAADMAFAEATTYDVDRTTISRLAGGVPVISLEEAASGAGVVYDPFDQRVTLHVHSSSDRWFCLDLSPTGRDHGFGDTFPSSLATCTDGVKTAGWGDAFSPTGPDQAAVAAVWESLAEALQTGDVSAAHRLFSPPLACPLSRLEATWPPGVPLLDADDFTIDGVSVIDSTAVSEITLGPLPASGWRVESDGTSWSIGVDPCSALSTLAAERADATARDLLEAGLFAVRSVFVVEQDFNFGAEELETIDADLIWVEPEALEYGRLSYIGTGGAGVLMTPGVTGIVCAVESATAATRYGVATTDIASPRACSDESPGG